MAGLWSEEPEFMEEFSETILNCMSAFPRKIVHTDELTRTCELTYAEIQLLAMLASGPASVEDAARTLCVAKTNLAILTRHLHELGYVLRITNPKDKRKLILKLTIQGVEKYEEVRNAVGSQLKRLVASFSKDEIVELIAAVRVLNGVLSQA